MKQQNSKIGKQYLASKIDITGKRILPYVQKPLSRTRKDIKDWNAAMQLFYAETPKNFMIQLLYNEIMNDALLTSQVQNRTQQVFSMDFELRRENGEVDEEQTALLKKLPSLRKFFIAMLETNYYGYNLVELELTQLANGQNDVIVNSIPRTNVVPQTGMFYSDYMEDKFIKYREVAEYGRFLLEFNREDIGILNKAVSHVLFKRFAQSCWSELCEIYGIPPRVMKTNTSDPKQLDKATRMMTDMGAAAWFVIDTTEQFEWAASVSTDGNVYDNLINLCNNEISLLISGAIIGQDTVNGNYSKEAANQEVLWQLVQSDMKLIEDWMTNIVLPAYAMNGILKPGLHLTFSESEDTDQLFKFTQGFLPFKEISDEWIKEKFGVEVTGNRTFGSPLSDGLNADNDFFV